MGTVSTSELPEGYNPAAATFRIVVRHPDDDHHDSEWASVGPVLDDLEEAHELLDSVTSEQIAEVNRRGMSLPLKQRVRATVQDRLAEHDVLGYEVKVQQLYETEWDRDDADQIVPVAHEWRDVESETAQPEED